MATGLLIESTVSKETIGFGEEAVERPLQNPF